MLPALAYITSGADTCYDIGLHDIFMCLLLQSLCGSSTSQKSHDSSWASSHAQYPSIFPFACKPHALTLSHTRYPLPLSCNNSQLPYPSPDLLASSAEYHAGCPPPSTSSPSQPRVLLLLSRVAHHAAYCSSTWDQLENLTRELKRSQIFGSAKDPQSCTSSWGICRTASLQQCHS